MKHGLTSYNYCGCRCDVCKTSKAEAYRRYADKRGIKKKEPYSPKHGTLGEYMNHHCRCVECREANRDYMRIKRTNHQLT